MALNKSCLCSVFAVFLLFSAVVSIFRFTAWKLERRQQVFRSIEIANAADAEEDMSYVERVHGIRGLLHTYTQQHDASKVLSDPQLCSRQFVLVGYPTTDALGDTTFEFLNGFAVAVILNRTLVGAQPSQDATAPWRSKWLVNMADLRTAWDKKGCSRGAELVATAVSGPDVAGIMGCCGNSSGLVVMISQCRKGHYFYQLRGSSEHESTVLVPSYHQETADQLFSVDEFTAFGLLLRAALVIPPVGPRVISALTKIEGYHTSKDLVVIGIHLRHTATSAEGVKEELDAALHSLKTVVGAHSEDRPCAILVASNRADLFSLVNKGSLLGCTAVRAERMEDGDAAGDVAAGAWLSSSALLDDLNLLSLSDVFVGSSKPSGDRSSVSMLIADLIASDHKEGSRNIYWIGSVTEGKEFEVNSFRTRAAEPSALLASVQCPFRSYCSATNPVGEYCSRLQLFESKRGGGVISSKGTVAVPGRQRPDGRPVFYNPKYDFRNRTQRKRNAAPPASAAPPTNGR